MLSKKIIVLAVVLFAVCFFGRMHSLAQSKQSKILYAEPARLMLSGDEKADREAETGSLLRETFYPIGWSKNGAFAYYVEPADEACGCYFAQLVIQDMRTDKVLWERSYNSENGGADTLKKYWAKSRKEFSRKLAQYGIRAQKKFALQSSAFNYQKDVLTPELKNNTNTEDEFAVSGNIGVQLISKQKGRKTIYERKFDPKKYEGFLDAEIAGSLLSPFETRAAIIMVETYRGWEGLPHITQIRIVGATLTTGFR